MRHELCFWDSAIITVNDALPCVPSLKPCTEKAIFCTVHCSRLNWEGVRHCADFERLMVAYGNIRLLSDLANDFWQSGYALTIPSYPFVNLSVSLAALVIGAGLLPVHVYILLPMTVVANLLFLLLFVPATGSTYPESQNSKFRMNRALMRLPDADRKKIQYFKRKIRAQRDFGFRVGPFAFISINTAQTVITESVSHSMVIISATKV